MEHSLFLRQYKYEIPVSSTAFSGLPAGKESRLISQLPVRLPVITSLVDAAEKN